MSQPGTPTPPSQPSKRTTDATNETSASPMVDLERAALHDGRPLAPEVARARQRIYHAHSALEADLDGLSEATHAAFDIPSKVRRNPVKSVALAGGAGFLLLGGPRRLIRSATSRIFPKRQDPYDGLLPDEVEQILRRSGTWDTPGVKEALEQDFAEYLRRKGRPQEPTPSAQTSFWRTYDALLGPLGTVGARLLVERLFSADRGRRSSGRGRSGKG